MKGQKPGEWLTAIATRRGIAAALVTVVTLGIIGVVLFAATPIGCGPAKAMGVKTIAVCSRQVAAHTPAIPSPSPLPTFVPPSSLPTPEISTPPSPLPTVTPTIPTTGPASDAYPPFYPASSAPDGTTAVPAVTLNCRLPVYTGPSGSGGFIVFPGGQFIADPSSAAVLPSPGPGQPSPVTVPPNPYQGPGYGPSFSYDAAYRKWLPVGFNLVSPDGRHYAFAATSGVYVVDLSNGALSNIGEGQAWTIVGVQNAGVYAEQSGKSGLWLLPYSGAQREITSTGFWTAASAGAAYGTPTSAVPYGVTNTIIRVEFSTGQVTNWFSRQGSQTNVLGIDSSGYPILSVNYFGQTPSSELWIANGGKGTPILGLSSGFSLNYGASLIADSHGVWFSASYTPPYQYQVVYNGFALYIPGHGVYWMSNLTALPGGACVQP